MRPQGVQVPSTPVFVDAIEGLAARGPSEHPPASALAAARARAARTDPAPPLLHEGAPEARARVGQAALRARVGRRMRVLFSAETPLTLTSYQSVLRELGERGHEVVVVFHQEREIGWRDRLLEEVAAPHVTIEPAASPKGDRWLELVGRPPLVARPVPVPRAAVQRDLPGPCVEARAEAGRRARRGRRSAAARPRGVRSARCSSWPSGRCRRTRRSSGRWPRCGPTSSCSRRISACARSSPTSCGRRRRSGCARRSA